MGLKNIDTSEKNVAVLEISIDTEVFEKTVTKFFKKNAPTITVPGFRKGKAPRNIIEKMYGKGVFHEDALNELVPEAVENAVTELKIKAVSKPEIDIKTIDENGVLFTAKIYVSPEAEVRKYKELEATKTIIKVTEQDIDNDIEQIRRRNSRKIEITDRAAAEGDDVVIDFEGFTDGVPFEGGKGTDFTLKLGSGQFIAGFEEQIIGKNVGETFDINVTFPEEYQAKELSGKAAVFKITLHEIKYEELPEIDDEFVKDVSEFDTVEEYRANVRKNIENRNNQRSEMMVDEQLMDELLTHTEVEIPQVMIETETDNQFSDYAYRLSQQGIDVKSYTQYTGMSTDQLREQFKSTAERHLRTRLALEKIVELENIEVDDGDLSKEFEKISKAYSMDIEDVKEKIDVNIIKEDIAIKKAVDFIKATAKVTEVEKTAAEMRAEHDHGHIHDENCDHDHDEPDENDE